ncbi:hypothetical protein BY458DRAFT_540250 [Sporodiniella umbellata]|nr:hypothetical protein BY458DRAFT_540250 [Sporodiniella umbellata]
MAVLLFLFWQKSIVERINNKFSFPDCLSNLSIPRSFNEHLKKRLVQPGTHFVNVSNGKIHPFLAASEIIIGVLSDNPTDSWSLLTVNKSATTDDSLSTNTDDLLTYIIRISPIYRHIVELNKDWAFFSQFEFATSHIFAGSILLSGPTALLVNCIESYGRSKAVDSHHERRTGSTTQQYSFPKTQSKYGDIVVCLTQDDNTTKLKIGASRFNLLKGELLTNATVEMGPNTSNFIPLPETRIYLNTEHLRMGKNNA